MHATRVCFLVTFVCSLLVYTWLVRRADFGAMWNAPIVPPTPRTADTSQGKPVMLNSADTSQGKPVMLNSADTSQGKPVMLNSADTSQGKPVMLNSADTSQGKPVMLNSADTSQGKPVMLNSADTSQGKPVMLNSADTSQGKPVMLNSADTSQEKPAMLNSADTSQGKPAMLNSADTSQGKPAMRKTVPNIGHGAWTELESSTPTAPQVIDTSKLNRNQGYSYLSKTLVNGNVNFEATGSYHLPALWFSELDLDILKDPPLTEVETIAQSATSLIHVSQVSQAELEIGDHVTVRIDLYNSRGRPVHKGGHSVRVWMTSGPKSAAADVQDLKNGSYLTSLPVLWAGKTTVFAGLMRPREHRGIVLKLLNTMKAIFLNTALYERRGISQLTYCLSIPVIPGFPEVCNMTSLNYGLPWYCGKPSKTNLRCSDWIQTRATQFPNHFPLTKTEDDVLRPYFERNYTFGIPQHLTFETRKGILPVSSSPCSEMTARDTWTAKSPRGFWDHGKWRPLKCSLPNVTSSFVKQCFRNTTVLLLGDSNTRMMLFELQKLAQCRLMYEGSVQDPIHCVKKSSHTTVSNLPHGYPFYVQGRSTSRFTKHPPSFYMDQVPSSGNYIVLIHLYAHYTTLHTHTYGLHVRQAARGVRDLLSRNPSVKVVIRGPHAFLWNMNRLHILGDYHGERSFRIFRQEFRDLVDRVIFLNVWDMTVANENENIHPEANPEIVRLFLGHVCPA